MWSPSSCSRRSGGTGIARGRFGRRRASPCKRPAELSGRLSRAPHGTEVPPPRPHPRNVACLGSVSPNSKQPQPAGALTVESPTSTYEASSLELLTPWCPLLCMPGSAAAFIVLLRIRPQVLSSALATSDEQVSFSRELSTDLLLCESPSFRRRTPESRDCLLPVLLPSLGLSCAPLSRDLWLPRSVSREYDVT